MKFLLPVGGIIDYRFGILTTYKHKAPPIGITAGMDWAGDNNAFTDGFQPEPFFNWLESMLPWRNTCLFIVCPDKVSDARRTLELFEQWQPEFTGWPVAFAAQDGQEDLELPKMFDALFVGGSTEWKCSQAAVEVIKRGQMLGKHIHIGRVNWGNRYRFFRQLEGSEDFTCDGTRTRFEGTAKTVRAWAGYQAQLPLFRI